MAIVSGIQDDELIKVGTFLKNMSATRNNSVLFETLNWEEIVNLADDLIILYGYYDVNEDRFKIEQKYGVIPYNNPRAQNLIKNDLIPCYIIMDYNAVDYCKVFYSYVYSQLTFIGRNVYDGETPQIYIIDDDGFYFDDD